MKTLIIQYVLLGNEHVRLKIAGESEDMKIFLKIINNPDHEEYEETMEWVGGAFDPEYFDVEEVSFDDPDERWKIAFKK